MNDSLKKIHSHLQEQQQNINQKSKQFIYHLDLQGKKLYSHGKVLIQKASFKEIYRQWYEQIAEVKTEPYEIALGVSLGLFLGILPLLGLHIFLALLIILFFRVNKVALFIGLALANPLVTPLIYSVSLKIGSMIFNTASLEISWHLITWNYIKHYLKPFLVGNLILAISVSLISYIITYYLVKYYKKKINNELSQKREN